MEEPETNRISYSRKLNILVLTYEYPPIGGGAGVVCKELSNRWFQSGHSITVLTAGLDEHVFTTMEKGVCVIRLATGRRKMHIAHPFQMLRWVWAAKHHLLKSNINYDVVLANFLLPGGLLARWVKIQWDLPYIILTHGHDVPGATPDQMRFYHMLLRPVMRRISRDSSTVVLLNNELKDLMDQFDPAREKYHVVIPNGLGSVNTNDRPVGKDKLKVVWAGRLVSQKQPELLLSILSRLDFPFHADVFGDGPLKTKLEKKLAVLPDRISVTMHGHVPREKVIKALESADVLLHTARFEAMSMVQLEACAKGVYIMTTRVGGVEVWLRSDINGQIIDDMNSGAWVLALKQFYQYRYKKGFQFPKKYGEEMINSLGWNVLARRYIKLFERAIDISN